MKIGVLALQGDVREHARALERVGATSVLVKHAEELASVDALIVPGGESTTIGKLIDRFGLLGPITERAGTGMPLYGTCAGAILMAKEIVGREDAPHRFPILDISVQRNAYGRQIDSFEAELRIDGLHGTFTAVFIRAPVIDRVGEDVEVLATCDEKPVLVRQGHLLASTFHPEMTDDPRIHELFLGMVA